MLVDVVDFSNSVVFDASSVVEVDVSEVNVAVSEGSDTVVDSVDSEEVVSALIVGVM